MMQGQSFLKEIPLDVVGSTVFGRYPKISIENTFNMIISDDWLVPFAGHQLAANISDNAIGRGLYSSIRFQHMIAVIDNSVYAIDVNLNYQKVGQLDTFSGNVYIDENNANQIAICDLENIYIYNYVTNVFSKATLDFRPGYITFMDTYFISVDRDKPEWRLSDQNDGLTWPAASTSVGLFQTKPDKLVGAIRVPGKGNLLYLFGSTVIEPWYDLGYQLFPFQRSSYLNIDYGCLSAATIATNDNLVVWLGGNEKSGPVILYSDGTEPKQISTDGINFRLANLVNPQNSFGFLFKQDGHQLYQITFPDDQFTLVFDFTTQKIFTITDEYMNYHIAKKVVFFNNNYYFISFIDGNVYELNTAFTTYAGKEIPRVRMCKSIRMPDQDRFVVQNMTFTIEQGQDDQVKRIDVSISKDGGNSFSNYVKHDMNPLGKRRSRVNFYRLGAANDFIPQFRFYGKGRFVVSNGTVSIYK